MDDDTKHNAHASDTTSADRPRDRLSEAEYLQREADDARGAVSHTLAKMRDSLKDAGDVKAWARTYPWTTVGAAAAAGFVFASALARNRHRPEPQDAALLERILTDEQIADRLKALAAEDERKPSRDGVVQTFVSTLLKTVGPAVQAAVTDALSAAVTSHQVPPSNGATAPESDAPEEPPQASAED